MNINFEPFYSSGYVHTVIPPDDMEKLDKVIWTADRTKKSSLAGIQTDNWMIPEATDVLSPYILNMVKAFKYTYKDLTDEYEQEVQKLIKPRYELNDEYDLKTIWVNITEKYMYNPPHNHQGIYSWVIFYDIPYSLEEERKNPKVSQSNQPFPGCFYFIFPTHSGHTYIQNIELSREISGHMILFPSRIYHGVHPYYSTDKKRISISGNVTL